MALIITPQSISEVAEQVIKRYSEKLYSGKYISIVECIRELAGNYYWLPVYEMIVKAELIDKDLYPGKFMIAHNFVVDIQEVNGVRVNPSIKEYVFSYKGLDFLGTLIHRINWENDHLRPYNLPYIMRLLK